MVRLNWKGATLPNIDIYRNNMLIATQPNDPGVYIDSTGDTGRAKSKVSKDSNYALTLVRDDGLILP
jgi:hypothetical protein